MAGAYAKLEGGTTKEVWKEFVGSTGLNLFPPAVFVVPKLLVYWLATPRLEVLMRKESALKGDI